VERETGREREESGKKGEGKEKKKEKEREEEKRGNESVGFPPNAFCGRRNWTSQATCSDFVGCIRKWLP